MSKKNTGEVRFVLDPNNLPTMSEERMAALRAMRDEDIDLSDIPSQAGKPGWRPGLYDAGVSDVRRAALREGLLLLDEDVVEGFRKIGDSSPQKMNAVLLEYLETHRKSA
jgi:uncharacterized protein (DUF4415 family)